VAGGAGGLTKLNKFLCQEGTRFPAAWILAGDGTALMVESFDAEEAPVTFLPLKEGEHFILQEVARAQAAGRGIQNQATRSLEPQRREWRREATRRRGAEEVSAKRWSQDSRTHSGLQE
jgi:hypothetical protein